MSSTDPNLIPKQDPQEDILDVLAEFETGLESLKALYAQRQRLQSRIRSHEEEVQKKEASLNERAAELSKAQAAHEQIQKDLEASLNKLQTREAELEAAAKAIASDRAALESSRGKLDEDTRARAKALEVQAAKLAEESRAVENLTHELEQQARTLEQQKAAFEQERKSRAANIEQVEALRKDLAAQRETLASHEKQSKDLQARVDALGRELTEARELAARHAKATQDAQTTAASSKSQIEQLQLRTSQFEQQNKELSKSAEAARAQAAQAHAQVEQLQQKAAQLEQQNAQFARSAENGKSASAAVQTQLAQLQSRASEFEKALAHERSETARLTAELTQQSESAAALNKTVESLNAKLKHELHEREEMRIKLEAAQAGLMQATARSNQLEAQLAKALNEVKSLQAAAAAKPKTSSNASMLRRKARLKLAHQLVRDRYHKLAKASEAIRKRVEQCDQVMAQRQDLANIRDRVILAERAALRKQAGGRAATMVLCAVAVFAILAGLSWAAAREIAPATYLATSQIAADGRGRQLNADELSEWQTFHQGLLGDPRFHETVADRFEKQGMTELATAPAVADLIRAELTTESMKPGQLTLHLKGQGSDRTARELETFTAAFVSHANSAQQQRIDGSVTQVSAPALAGADPIDNTRTIYAGGILAVGVVFAGALWMFLWKRLVGAKTAFETDADVAAALDDAKWSNFATSGAAAQVAQNTRNR